MQQPQSGQIFTIKTFTLVSDLEEDRLRLNACDAAGMTQSVMLTRRLLDRAVPAMAQEVEKRAGEGPIPAEFTLPIAQEKLRQARRENPVPAVQVAPDTAPWLCTEMQFAPRDNGMVWIIKGRGGEEARMFLTHQNLRATLDVFATRYQAMAWGMEPFPEWLAKSTQTTAQSPAVLH